VSTRCFRENQVGTKSTRGRRLAVFLTALAVVVLLATVASAGSRSSLVFVSVQVVSSCRVENTTSQTSDAMDLKMRCSSTARPSLGLVGTSQFVAPVGTVTLPHSQIATTENGKTLNIEF
jgi:hypothetical protein